ncbi:hypothetical protein FHG87_020780, partial [Trinorchestia longiramus]
RSETTVDKVDGARRINEVLNNSGTKPLLFFLQYILRKVNSLNVEFQSENFQLHRLHMMVTTEYRNILSFFVTEKIMQCVKLSDIDPINACNHKKMDDIYLGGLAMMHLINKPLPTEVLLRFKNDCLKFLVELCVQIRKRFSMSEDSLITKLNVLDPTVA